MKRNVLYFHLLKAPFVEKDINIINNKYDIKDFLFKSKKSIFIPLSWINQLIFILKNLSKNTLFVSQFSSYHTFIPSVFTKVFKIPHVIVLGGTECNYLPPIKYGNKKKLILSWFTKKSLEWATLLLPVSEELVISPYDYDAKMPKFQGFKAIYPSVLTTYRTIHNGVDPTKFSYTSSNEIRKIAFISIASGLSNETRRQVKGVDLIISVAPYFEEYEFCIIGDNINIDLPNNVKIIPFLDNEKLPLFLTNYTHYLQLSLIEGFPNALLEAMLCGCIPIVSHVGILPTIVENVGYVLRYKDTKLLISLLSKCISEYNSNKSEKSRKKVMDNYTLNKREKHLLDALDSID